MSIKNYHNKNTRRKILLNILLVLRKMFLFIELGTHIFGVLNSTSNTLYEPNHNKLF